MVSTRGIRTETRNRGRTHPCPIARAAALLADAWTMLILRDLASGLRRFGEIEVSTGISPRVLSGRLRDLEREGLVIRECFAEIPPRVEYTLTAKGHAAMPVVQAMKEFGAAWLDGCEP